MRNSQVLTADARPAELSQNGLLDELLREFCQITGLTFRLPDALYAKAAKVVSRLSEADLLPHECRAAALHRVIRDKLKLSAGCAAAIYGAAAKVGTTYNFAQKSRIVAALDAGDEVQLMRAVRTAGLPDEVIASWRDLIEPVSDQDAVTALRHEFASTLNPRTKRPDEAMTQPMLHAIFAAFTFHSFDRAAIHSAITDRRSAYHPSFWSSLSHGNAQLSRRDNAAWLVRLSQQDFSCHYDQLRSKLANTIKQAFEEIDNHGFLIVRLANVVSQKSAAWKLCADLVMFAQYFIEGLTDKGYFQRESIECLTSRYITELNLESARIDVVCNGFTYLDCFVNSRCDVEDILLIFQKNRSDETLISCPSCRSSDVRGNSYPQMGVKSWECQNYICPDRSKSNRGKRYSFLSLLKQQSFEDNRNLISPESLRRWRRDVVEATDDQMLSFAVEHFTQVGDQVHVFGTGAPDKLSGRLIVRRELPPCDIDHFEAFAQSAFFRRFLVDAVIEPGSAEAIRLCGEAGFRVLEGDALQALTRVPSASIDGAVTSPPYYNARDYAQWGNLYCYQYDMYNVAREVLRVLKPGGLFLYNIFDYFDNDNIVALSALGNRRLTLSAFAVYSFRQAGFEVLGNVVWDKGEIEGKRGFNGGNATPFYQTPFNCWEHVLIFAKAGGGAALRAEQIPRYIRQKPVFKMVRGVNTHGHTAPFPDAIPRLLLDTMEPGQTVIDPFAGSLTTARVAEQMGINSISIEREPRFVELGLRLREDRARQMGLPL